jgi:hypothetical protein
MQLTERARQWLLTVNRPDPYGLERARQEELVAQLEREPEPRSAGDYEGHPFHGNQWKTGIEGGGRAPNLGKRLLAELKALGPMKVRTFKTEAEATKNIDDYLMAHYGITSEGQARALTDTQRGVLIAPEDPRTVLQQFISSVPRPKDPELKSAFGVFEKLLRLDPIVDLMDMTNPIVAVGKLFTKWGLS